MHRYDEWPDVRLIRKQRKDLGITQKELASLCGILQPVISKIEAGKIADPSYSSVQKIFEGLQNFELGKSDRGKTHSVRQLTAEDLMNQRVITVKPTDRVKDAWIIMKKNGFSQLPVVDEKGRIAGGIAENAVASEAMENIMEKRVQEVMGD
ncbi:MAG: CBS domain-containing protein, partial [Nitrososphaera sp.]